MLKSFFGNYSEDFFERLVQRVTHVDLIINPVTGLYPLEDSESYKIPQFSLHGLKRKTDLVHDLPLIKPPAWRANQKGKNSHP